MKRFIATFSRCNPQLGTRTMTSVFEAKSIASARKNAKEYAAGCAYGSITFLSIEPEPTKEISKKLVTIDTSEYRFSHGHEPKGRGCWAFSAKRNPNVCNKNEVKWYSGTYAEARRQAVAEAAANGITRIYAQP